ncbi:MAG: substrate-binding domain-containing protein [Lachnospiraceae bacterium]|nr:substrate-binding domain-containing protein [Lachnospiraceae bacterium]
MKLRKALAMGLAAVMMVSFPACQILAEEAETEAESTEFDPDHDESGIDFTEMREQFGAMPEVADGLVIGGLVKQLQNEFWQSLKSGYEDMGTQIVENTGVELTVDVQAALDESDEEGQLTSMNNMINKAYDGILFSPISDSNLTSAVDTCNDGEIVAINVDDGVAQNTNYFVGPNAYQNGVLAAYWIAEKLDYEGQVAVVIGKVSAYAARERTAGFVDTIAEIAPDIEVVAQQSADWDRQTAKELTETWLTQYPDLDAVFSNNDDMALGVVEAVREYEEETGIHVYTVGVDGNSEAYDSIREGGLDATIDSFPYYMGMASMEVMVRQLNGQDMPKVIWTPQALIDSENVDSDPAEIIGWTDAEY